MIVVPRKDFRVSLRVPVTIGVHGDWQIERPCDAGKHLCGGRRIDEKFEYTSLITAIMAISVGLPTEGRQDSEFKAYGFVWVRKVSVFFKTFQNGDPNWKREAQIPSRPAPRLPYNQDRAWQDPAAIG